MNRGHQNTRNYVLRVAVLERFRASDVDSHTRSSGSSQATQPLSTPPLYVASISVILGFQELQVVKTEARCTEAVARCTEAAARCTEAAARYTEAAARCTEAGLLSQLNGNNVLTPLTSVLSPSPTVPHHSELHNSSDLKHVPKSRHSFLQDAETNV